MSNFRRFKFYKNGNGKYIAKEETWWGGWRKVRVRTGNPMRGHTTYVVSFDSVEQIREYIKDMVNKDAEEKMKNIRAKEETLVEESTFMTD